jgi:hypothetical protein
MHMNLAGFIFLVQTVDLVIGLLESAAVYPES